MKNLLLITILFCSTLSFAQITFEKGYYISNSGNRTACFIKNIDWRNNPKEFEYKIKADDSQSKKETIASIQEFGIDNVSKYKRFKVNIERSGSELKYLSKSKNPIWKEETLFLKLLVEGDATLYGFSEENLNRYFYETKNTPLEQLVYLQYISDEKNEVIDNYNEHIKVNNQFRQQLYNNVRCVNTPVSDFEKITYRKSDLVKHFTKYNSCGSNPVINYEPKNNKNLFSLKITPSINLASLSISDPNQYNNKSTDIKGKAVFKIGFEVEYVLPFNKNTWSIFLNPAYQKYEAEKTYVNNDGFGVNGADVTNNVKVDYSSIEIPIGIRHYFFLNNTSKIFVNAAYVIDVAGGSHFDFDNNKKLDSSAGKNFALGIGYNFKNKYSAELRLNTARNLLSDYISWSADYTTFGIIFGYTIL